MYELILEESFFPQIYFICLVVIHRYIVFLDDSILSISMN